jgi:GntR family transcriptional regulator
MCNSTAVIPFSVHFRPGIPLFEQVVYAAQKAMISGQLLPGDPFPSVRALSRELKINPNTAHKIVAQLVSDGLLETRPGIGNVVAARPDSTRKERTQLLTREVEQLVVEAKRLGIARDDILASIAQHWDRLSPDPEQDPDKTTPEDGGRRKR